MTDSRVLEPGAVIVDRYRIVRQIGEGGMATVFVADDLKLATQVALKILHPHLRSRPAVVDRFKNEVLAARRVEHPGVIRIFDMVETDAHVLLVLELVEGRDVHYRLMESGPFEESEAVGIVNQACEAIAAAHAAGVIHGDIKPHNLLLNPDGKVKIIDFGMARVNALAGLTRHSMVMGTPEYMAPEQLSGHSIDTRTDIYGLGVMLFELLSGRLPFRGLTAYEIIGKKTTEGFPGIQTVCPSVSDPVARTIERATAVEPEDRFQGVDSMRRALTGECLVALSSSPTRTCKSCNAALVDAIPYCFVCSKRVSLVQQRMTEPYAVMVIQRRRVGVEFFHRRDGLTYEQKFHVMERVKETTGLSPANPRSLDRRLKNPPFMVMDGLTKADAERLAADLAGHDMRTRVIKRGVSKALLFFRYDPLFSGLVLLNLALAGLTSMTHVTIADLSRAFFVEGHGGQFLTLAASLTLTVLCGVAISGALLLHNMKALSTLVRRPPRLLARLLGRKQISAVERTAREAAANAETFQWLAEIAERNGGGLESLHLRRTLARLFSRAAQLQIAVEDLDETQAEGRDVWRTQLSAALQRACELSRKIDDCDRFLVRDEAAQAMDALDHLQRRRQEPGADLAVLDARAEDLQAQLRHRAEVEHTRTQLHGALLQISVQLQTLHRRVLEISAAEHTDGERRLTEALEELDSQIEGLEEAHASVNAHGVDQGEDDLAQAPHDATRHSTQQIG